MDLATMLANMPSVPDSMKKILRPLVAAQLLNAHYTALQSKIAPGTQPTNEMIKAIWFEVLNNWKIMESCLDSLEYTSLGDLYKNFYDGIPKVLHEEKD